MELQDFRNEKSTVSDRIETVMNVGDTIVNVEKNRVPRQIPGGSLIMPSDKKTNDSLVEKVQTAQSEIGEACNNCLKDAETLGVIGLLSDDLLRRLRNQVIDENVFCNELNILRNWKNDLETDTKKHLKALNVSCEKICELAHMDTITLNVEDPLKTVMDMSYDYQRAGLNVDKVYEMSKNLGKTGMQKLSPHHSDILQNVLSKKASEAVGEIDKVQRVELLDLPTKSLSNNIDIIVVNNIPKDLLEKNNGMHKELLRVVDYETNEVTRRPIVSFEGEEKNGRKQIFVHISEWEKLTERYIPDIDGEFKDLTGDGSGGGGFKNIRGTVAPYLKALGYNIERNQSREEVKDIVVTAARLYPKACDPKAVKQYFNLLRNLNVNRPKIYERTVRDMEIATEVRYELSINGKDKDLKERSASVGDILKR